MIKLNNKGFAISTMLYGITTIIIIVLILILSIMRSSYNKESVATDQIYYYLNKCISKQIELENCYKNSSSYVGISCSEEYKRYTECTREYSNQHTEKKYLNNTLIDRASIQNSDIISDPTTNNRYVFIGQNPANYIKIGNITGRIISLDSNGKIKVLIQDAINTSFNKDIKPLETEKDRWENSTIYNSLNNKFNNLPKNSFFTEGNVHLGVIYGNETTEAAFNTIKSISADYDFSLPSLEDYLKASGDSSCQLNSSQIETALINCTKHNWLANNNCAWTSTGYQGTNNYMTYSSNGVEAMEISAECDAYLVIYLSPNTSISTIGDGNSLNPYVIE